MEHKELAGKVSLVTGAGRGIGRTIALKLAEMGSNIAVNDLPGNDLIQTVCAEIEEMGVEAFPAPADITDAAGVKAMVRSIIDRWGSLNILVNNAAITGDNLLLRMTEQEWDAVMDTNLKGAYLCSKNALRYMIQEPWGRIINISSVAGIIGGVGRANYAASKGALIAFTKSMAREMGPLNITVNAIAPGYVLTELSQGLSQQIKDEIASRVSIKRFGAPEDIAHLAGFLASRKADYITAQVIAIDGGFL